MSRSLKILNLARLQCGQETIGECCNPAAREKLEPQIHYKLTKMFDPLLNYPVKIQGEDEGFQHQLSNSEISVEDLNSMPFVFIDDNGEETIVPENDESIDVNQSSTNILCLNSDENHAVSTVNEVSRPETVLTEIQNFEEKFEDVLNIQQNNDERQVLNTNATSTAIEETSGDDSTYDPDIDFAEDSADNEANKISKKSRKRDVHFWEATANKVKRQKGDEYFGRKKGNDNTWKYEIRRPKRQLKPRCSCSNSLKEKGIKCRSVSEDHRKQIFTKFWNMSWNEKRLYVRMLTNVKIPERKRDRKEMDKSRRSASLEYNLKIGNNMIRVCKTMFLNTLSVGEWSVLNWSKDNHMSIEDNENLNDVTDGETKDILKSRRMLKKESDNLNEFLDTLPKIESHYCRASTKKLYLEPLWLSKTALYEFYKNDWCLQKNINPMSITRFKQVFIAKNLSLFRPKKDECDICAAFKHNNIEEDVYQNHINKKKKARIEKQKDKDSQIKTFTVDLQAVLLAPKNNVSSMYYKTKLAVHNLTMFDLQTKNGYCFLWNETEGNLTSDEFASIIIEFLLSIKDSFEQQKEVILFSDGCNYQNRNATLGNALLNFAKITGITVYQKYLERGHTQMEVDAMHSTIERKLKGVNINLPADYVAVCKRARKSPKPYDVTYLTHGFFKNFSSLGYVRSIRPGKKPGEPTVTDLRALKYNPNGSIQYKLRFTEDWKDLPTRIQQKDATPFEQLPCLYLDRIPIKSEKFNHLQILKNTINQDYHAFYDSIPHI